MADRRRAITVAEGLARRAERVIIAALAAIAYRDSKDSIETIVLELVVLMALAEVVSLAFAFGYRRTIIHAVACGKLERRAVSVHHDKPTHAKRKRSLRARAGANKALVGKAHKRAGGDSERRRDFEP